jgi:GNAT superfamily N-acetyltransferase
VNLGTDPTTELRVATAQDIPALQSLIDLSVRHLSTAFYTPAQIDASLVHVFGVDSQLIIDGTYYVVASGERVVAGGGWSGRSTLFGGDQAKRSADDILDPATSPARIRAFFVHPDWTRRGFARQIFAACERAASARGFRRFELMATLPGVPLYRALGFVAREEVPVEMPGGLVLPCIRMEREIGGTVVGAAK